MSKRILITLLSLSVVISLFFNLYKKDVVPPCLNSDEAAHGYNAYSILHTGKDEYGSFFPLRLKSFGEYKMPMYSYLSMPFVGALDLNDSSVRGLNTLIAVLFPIAIFFLAKKLFARDGAAVIASFLISFCLGLAIAGRHAHEAYLATFFLTCALYFFINALQKPTFAAIASFLLFTLLALFSYSAIGIYIIFLFLYSLTHIYKNKPIDKNTKLFIISFFSLIGFFIITNFMYKPARAQNLFLTNNQGFSLSINELRGEGGNRFAYNKATVGARSIIYKISEHYSPQFLAINGDENLRFGFPMMAPITIVEYAFLFIGMYFLFRNKERWRYFLLLLLFVAPIPASLTWAENSLTRSLFLLIPILLISSYGMYQFLSFIKENKFAKLFIVFIVLTQSIFLYYSWDFYLNHYPKRAAVIRSWDCGYKELGTYIRNNYDKFDSFYITKKNGQPYIFTLFYLQYPPEKYQRQAKLSPPDEFGFGQVEKFDKFNFNFNKEPKDESFALIGYPDDFEGMDIDQSKIKKITVGTEEIFWIYEK